MKIIVETHRYAPELNKAHIVHDQHVVAVLPAPGCTSVREARNKLFAPLKYTGRFVKLQAINVDALSIYNRERKGFCNDMISLAGALHNMRQRHNLPGCAIKVTSRLIG